MWAYDAHVVAWVQHVTKTRLKHTQLRCVHEALMPFRVDRRGRDGLVIVYDVARSRSAVRALEFALEYERSAA